MAKWGEGDPRWIVEERADATNVNNWHWTERDVTAWSEERLKSLLQEVRVEGSEGVCQVTDVSKLEGEACINNRKGKLFYFYEWVIRAYWTGTAKTGVKYRGTVDVANLSDENDADDLDISVALCADHPPTPLVQLMKTKGIPEVRRALDNYTKQLKTEFSQGMILPTANGPKAPPPPAPSKPQVQSKTQISSAPSSGATCSAAKTSTGHIQLKETFFTTPDEVYATFISQDFVQIFTRSPAQVDARNGGKFQLLDGSVSGEFVQLVPDKGIEMKWRFRSWPKDHFATVILLFEDRGGETGLSVDIQGVPSGSEDSTREGWNRFYLQAIKQTFGY
ncbi:activator of 90 kDa heat shock protein ATPase homolog 1-like [Boleophthalmus pectinirostris]|uniref:activator of 90 kDa heat shock protein ATPase homolog 1-like n=1 Tax=Boleophthalmus pectinirostris TaxID=150288 RepID=UPI002433340D|nr:activator of 90 kDa heat shock protein ATPase homolog 1-like [Boleophthalmus pectinirostris]